jgi:hypothetical protein
MTGSSKLLQETHWLEPGEEWSSTAVRPRWKPDRNHPLLHWIREMPYAHSKARPPFRRADTVSPVSAGTGSRGIRSCHGEHGGQQCPVRVKAYRTLAVAGCSWVYAQAPCVQGASTSLGVMSTPVQVRVPVRT